MMAEVNPMLKGFLIMPVTKEELDSFHQFVLDKLDNGGAHVSDPTSVSRASGSLRILTR